METLEGDRKRGDIDMETQKHREMEPWRHGDMDLEKWRHQMENRSPGDFP
jgi:hypothetical protein